MTPSVSQSRRGRNAGLALLAAVALFALATPPLAEIDPARQSLAQSLTPPGSAHWFGTDVLGRSVLARLAEATRLSLGLALLASFTAAVPGTLLGVLAAWRGGAIERLLVLLADAVLSVPGLLLVLLMAMTAPGKALPIYLGLALAQWVEYFRVARAASRPVLAGDAVQASRLLGFGPLYLLRRHLLPALAPVLGTLLALGTAQAVLAVAALGFISVGLQPPTPELGLMLVEFLPHYEEAPWLIAAPVSVLMLTVLGMLCLAQKEQAHD